MFQYDQYEAARAVDLRLTRVNIAQRALPTLIWVNLPSAPICYLASGLDVPGSDQAARSAHVGPSGGPDLACTDQSRKQVKLLLRV